MDMLTNTIELLFQYLSAAVAISAALLPAFFAGTIFGYNYIFLPPVLKHSEERVLAQQWLEAYQFGARYVRRLMQAIVYCNVYLAARAVGLARRSEPKTPLANTAMPGHLAAMLVFMSIMAYTLIVMEPGINGALKVKVETIMGENEVDLKHDNVPVGEERQTATSAWKERAQRESLRSLILVWKRCNDWRMAGAALSAAVSMCTSLAWA